MEPFNCVETIAIPVCKQISFNSFKNKMKLPTNYPLTNNLCISVEMCASKWLILNFYCYIAVLETISLFAKKWSQACLKMLSTKCVYK